MQQFKRYQIFNSRESSSKPVFSAPWRWLAHSLAALASHKWECCRLVDSTTGEALMEWITATRPLNLDFERNAAIAFNKQTPDGRTQTLYFGTTNYRAGCEPQSGHRPVTIIDVETSEHVDVAMQQTAKSSITKIG